MHLTTRLAPVAASPATNAFSGSGGSSGFRNPIAKSTSSVFSSSFRPVGFMTGLPPLGLGAHSISSTSTPQTCPFLPTKRVEDKLHRRVQPSSWLLLVFRIRGYCGQGVSGLWPAGGFGRISICVTLRAPCRLLVPMQSLPVSPPPMTSTCFPYWLWLIRQDRSR